MSESGKPKMKDTKHLTNRGGNWYLNYKVPKNFQKLFGKALIQRSLKTDSLTKARGLRDIQLRELKAQEAMMGAGDKERLALLVHEYSKMAEALKLTVDSDGDECNLRDMYDIENIAKTDKVDAAALLIAESNGERQDALGYSIRPTIKGILAKYLKDDSYSLTEHNKRLYERAVNYLVSFNGGEDLFLEGINRAVVKRFIEHLRNRDLSPIKNSTILKLINPLNVLWKYALDWEYTSKSSPFSGHTIIPKTEKRNHKQPFTQDEWKRLLPTLNESATTYGRKWFTPIALMTGMRQGEIAGLRVDDVFQNSDGVWFFDINSNHRVLKTKSATRKIPIHSSILNAVLKLKQDSANEFLFPEVAKLKDKGKGVAKWFGEHKKALISSDPNKCFHSIRGMFITGCVNAKLPPEMRRIISGHKHNDIGMDVYFSGLEGELIVKLINKAGEALKSFSDHFPKD
jgi:integrase